MKNSEVFIGASLVLALLLQKNAEASQIKQEVINIKDNNSKLITKITNNIINIPEIQKINVEQPELPSTVVLNESYLYADYQIPLYSIINRVQTDNVYKAYTSIGGFSDIKNIDLGSVPRDKWIQMGFTLSISLIFKVMGGPAGTILGYLWSKYSKYIFKEPTSKIKLFNKAVAEIKGYPKRYSIPSRDGLFLGTLAKNRAGSNLIPLIKIINKDTYDATYITSELLPIFIQAGYTTEGSAIGYVSTIPFKDSTKLRLMYHLFLNDFVLVTDGSEYERILVNSNYLPVVDLGYISIKIQRGQQSIIIKDLDQIENITKFNTTTSTFLTKFSNSYSSSIYELQNNIGITPKGTKLFPYKYIYPYATKDQAFLDYTHSNKTTRTNKHTNYSPFIINKDLFTKYTKPRDKSILQYYKPINEVYNIHKYIGLDVPPVGCTTDIITESMDNIYFYNSRAYSIKRGTRRILINMLNGALIEVILGDKIINAFDIRSIISASKKLAIADNPLSMLRVILGNFLDISTGRPVYLIQDINFLRAQQAKYYPGMVNWYTDWDADWTIK